MLLLLKQGSAPGSSLNLESSCFFSGWHAALSVWRVLWVLLTSLWLRRQISGANSSTPLMFMSNLPGEHASREFKLFKTFNSIKYLSVMEPLKAIGAFDKYGLPKEPTYSIGPVTEKGTKLPPGKGQCNHADHIDEMGYYDIAKYLKDFKCRSPSISNGNG